MNPTRTNLGSTNSQNSMGMQHEIDVPFTYGSMSKSEAEPGSTKDLNTMSQLDEIAPPSTFPVKRPCADLLGTSEQYFEICLPLYEASVTCDWQAAKAIIEKCPEVVRFAITEKMETALHIAASAEATKRAEEFLENLVNMMEKEDILLETLDHDQPLQTVATGGNTKMAEILLNKMDDLLTIVPGERGRIPVITAAYWGNHDMTRYLYHVSEKMSSRYTPDLERRHTIIHCVRADMFDIALEIMTDHPEIITIPEYAGIILDHMVGKLEAVNRTEPSMLLKIIDSIFAKVHIKKRIAKKNNSALYILKLVVNRLVKFTDDALFSILKDGATGDMGVLWIHQSGILFSAAEIGNTRLVIELIQACPRVLWMQNKDGHTIFHIAIMHRHQGIYNLLYELGSRKALICGWSDSQQNTILHLIGMTSKKIQLEGKSRASLLMQRDLLWFQDVEKMIPSHVRGLKNRYGQTAYQLFFDNNKELVTGSLKWMKDSMVVATLIVTVAFAVAFTIPGGYSQDNGIPIFIYEPSFLVFIIADAITLFSSSTSLLVFLSILTSHVGQRDFLYSLPKKLMIGLITLFISVVAMMITFAASFFVLYRNGLKWIPITISIFASTPVVVFAGLQSPLWLDMFRSMYDSRYIFHPRRPMLYDKNLRL